MTPERPAASWPEQTFAEEVARSQDGRTILFRVSRELAEVAGDKLYDPVRFRFVERDDGTYEMECLRVSSPWDHPLADAFESVRGDLYLFSIGEIGHATLVGSLLEAVALIEIDKGAEEAIRNA